MLALNIGSGQRRFESIPGVIEWKNLDCVSRPDQVPDIICNPTRERLPFEDRSVDAVVLSQVYEHFHLGEGLPVLVECYRVLRDGGTLWVTVPNMRALVQRWLAREISDYIFMVNVYGAYQGKDGDDHHWGWTTDSLFEQLSSVPWSRIGSVMSCDLPSCDLAFDWWILAMKATK